MNSNARGIHNSPGIYTREVDISNASVKSLGVTTLGLVGETLIGPAFQPVQISTYSEFQSYFGGTNPEKYANGFPKYELGYIAKSYLQQSQQLYVTRVLGLSGYRYQNLWALCLQNGGNNTYFAILRSKAEYVGEQLTPIVTGITMTTSGFTGLDSIIDITVVYATGTETYKVSLNPASKSYILKVLGSSPKLSNSKVFVEEMYEGVINNALVSGSNNFSSGSTLSITGDTSHNDYSSQFSYAKTPWFVSEMKGSKIIPLFRFLTLSDGDNANNLFKISIRNINPITLKFDVVLRAIYDTDAKPIILEQYTNCTLDPTDGNNYLGAKIGTVDELFQLKSKYIMVEIINDSAVKESVPMGFSGYEIKSISGTQTPSIVYNNKYEDTGSAVAKKPFFGLSNTTGIDNDFFSFKGLTGLTLTNGFHLEAGSDSINFVDPSNVTVNFTTLSGDTYAQLVSGDTKLMKFTAYFSGGFDGWDVFRTNRTNTDDYQYNKYLKNNSEFINTNTNFKTFGQFELGANYGLPNVPVSTGMTSDFYAFWSAARSFSDPEAFDINVFATPGIDWVNNPILVSEVIDMVENERKDSIYILTTPDKQAMVPSGNTVSDSKNDMISAYDIVDQLVSSEIDSNYAATYYPWCQYYDVDNGVYVYLPVTRDVVKGIAYTDNTAYAWFPPAGLGRGSVDCVKAKKSLVLDEEDVLSGGGINVIKTFALDGVKIWGQRTLQVADTALNRIGVRRMMLYLRKSVRRGNLPLIFEPNDNTTKNKFLEIVNPILNSVKTNRGLSDYEIVIDDSPEAKARHEMNVQIWIKPVGILEYISIDFMITPEGFDFSTL